MGKREIKSKTGTAVALILFQSMLYGFGDAISKAAFEIMPVYSLITARYAIAFVLLILIYHKTVLKEIRAVSWKVWILPSLCISLGMIFNNIAINCTAATTAAFLRSLSTIMTPILAFLIYKKRLKKSECISLRHCRSRTLSSLRKRRSLVIWVGRSILTSLSSSLRGFTHFR